MKGPRLTRTPWAEITRSPLALTTEKAADKARDGIPYEEENMFPSWNISEGCGVIVRYQMRHRLLCQCIFQCGAAGLANMKKMNPADLLHALGHCSPYPRLWTLSIPIAQ